MKKFSEILFVFNISKLKREHEKKTKLNEKLKKEFEDYEKEDVAIREAIKHAKEQIKKLQKAIDTEKEKVIIFVVNFVNIYSRTGLIELFFLRVEWVSLFNKVTDTFELNPGGKTLAKNSFPFGFLSLDPCTLK